VSPSRRKAPSWGAARSLTVAAVAVLAGPGLAGADEPAGGLDRIEEGRLRGWAADPARPGRALSVHVYVDGAYVGRAVAALPRSEAPGALGFSFALPERPAGRHEVTAFVLDPDGAPARLGPRHPNRGGRDAVPVAAARGRHFRRARDRVAAGGSCAAVVPPGPLALAPTSSVSPLARIDRAGPAVDSGSVGQATTGRPRPR